MAYMVAGYLIIWVVSFVFIFSMVQRQRNLQREIETLKEMSGENQAPTNREAPEFSKPRATVR